MIGSLLRRDRRHPEIELSAYAADCCVKGWLRLTEARLSDMLNRRGELRVADVRVLSYSGTDDLDLPRLTLHRDDLYAVLLGGPRGDASRWKATDAVAIGIKAGPYLIRGHVHVAPGEDGVAAFERGREMVALTNGWIARTDGARGEEPRKVRVDALLVNRLLAEWVTHADADDPTDAAQPYAWPGLAFAAAPEAPV